MFYWVGHASHAKFSGSFKVPIGVSNRHSNNAGRRPCQPTGLRVSQPESANRKARVSQQEGASQPTGRRESANQEGASQPTRKARVSQPGRESANQAASHSQPGRESANQVASQTSRSRVRQPGRESDNQVARRT